MLKILFSRSIDHDAHTFVVHYDTYNSDATLHIDGVLPLGELEKNVKQYELTIYHNTQQYQGSKCCLSTCRFQVISGSDR